MRWYQKDTSVTCERYLADQRLVLVDIYPLVGQKMRGISLLLDGHTFQHFHLTI